jgi:hypothetical protein
VPAWDTRFFPSTVTFIDRVARLSCTFRESSLFWLMCCSATHILPGQEGLYADARTIESGSGRMIEARDDGPNSENLPEGAPALAR